MCASLAGDQSGGVGQHHVLHPGRAFVLGLDVLRLADHRKCDANAVIAIAIRLRHDYDPTTTYCAPLLPFDAGKK